MLMQMLIHAKEPEQQPHADYQEIVSSNNQSLTEDIALIDINTPIYNEFQLKRR